MRAAAAAAGVVSAAMFFAPGCDRASDNKSSINDPVRRASFRSLAARDFLFTCTGGPARIETRRQLERMNELNRFAFEKGAMPSLQLAANDWTGLSQHDTRGRCSPGEPAYQAALADFSARLDQLAAGIGNYSQ